LTNFRTLPVMSRNCATPGPAGQRQQRWGTRSRGPGESRGKSISSKSQPGWWRNGPFPGTVWYGSNFALELELARFRW